MASRRPLSVPDVGNALRAQFGQDLADVADRDGHAVVTITEPRYRELITVLRDDPEFDCDYFDFLTAVDFPDQQQFEVVVHVYSNSRNHHVRVKLRIPRDEPVAPTIHDIYPGANWFEREAWELFGIVFEGHPHLVKLVLPEPFEGHPLRKDFELMSRVAKPWPGAAEGEEGEEE
ncbi:MAG TPA: NADH-quinone oxidoreductase subunit C [Actinomycetota bacterium]